MYRYLNYIKSVQKVVQDLIFLLNYTQTKDVVLRKTKKKRKKKNHKKLLTTRMYRYLD